MEPIVKFVFWFVYVTVVFLSGNPDLTSAEQCVVDAHVDSRHLELG